MRTISFLAMALFSIAVVAQKKAESFDRIASPVVAIPTSPTAPGQTTNALYNMGGRLYWGQMRLDTIEGSDSVPWVHTASGRTILKHQSDTVAAPVVETGWIKNPVGLPIIIKAGTQADNYGQLFVDENWGFVLDAKSDTYQATMHSNVCNQVGPSISVQKSYPSPASALYRFETDGFYSSGTVNALGGNSAQWNAKEPAIAAGTTSQYWRGDKSWQTLPTTVTPASNILSWDGSKYTPYADKLVSDPGYPYFFTYNGTPPYKTASFTRHLTLDGQFRANSLVVCPSGTSNQNLLSLSGNSASLYGYQTNFQNYFEMVKDTGNVNYITAYAVRTSGWGRRSNPIWIGDNTTFEGRVNEQIIVDPANNRFDINMTKVRLNKGPANKYLKTNANKEIEYVDLPASTWTLGTGIQTSTVDTVNANILISGIIKSTAMPGTDHSVSGDVVPLTANAASSIGDVVYINSSGKAQICKADTISNCRYAMAVCADASIAANVSGSWLTKGSIKDATWSWIVGGLIYVSTSGYSGATLTQSAPAGANNVIMPVGVALSSSTMYFFGNINSVEHQ